jgi:hypothetical protein
MGKHHFWVAHEGYDECALCRAVKVQNKVYATLYHFVLKFLENNFQEIFLGVNE